MLSGSLTFFSVRFLILHILAVNSMHVCVWHSYVQNVAAAAVAAVAAVVVDSVRLFNEMMLIDGRTRQALVS